MYNLFIYRVLYFVYILLVFGVGSLVIIFILLLWLVVLNIYDKNSISYLLLCNFEWF